MNEGSSGSETPKELIKCGSSEESAVSTSADQNSPQPPRREPGLLSVATITRTNVELEAVKEFDRNVLNLQRRLEFGREHRFPDACFAGLPRDDAFVISDPEVTRRVLEIVIGADDRVPVADVSIYPWRCICSLQITAADGSQWSGSGWLVAPRLIVTAGHVVYMETHGGWVREIRVRAGATAIGAAAPDVLANQFRSVTGWVRDGDYDYDYGAIVLPPERPLGNELGYFGLGYPDASWLMGVELNLSGYPADKPPDTQWYHSRRAIQVSNRQILYNIDTAGGQSGAPVWVTLPEGRFVVGVHSSGHVTGNSAVRITAALAGNLLRWAQEA